MSESYDPPPGEVELADLSPEDAQGKINQLIGACSRDRNHPYFDGGHPQNKDYSTYAHRLYQIVGAADAAKQEAAHAEAIARQEAGISADAERLTQEASGEMEKLVALGFEKEEIPDNIAPYQVTALKMQRLAAEGDFANLAPLLTRELQNLQAPADTLAAFRAFTQAGNMDPALKAKIAEQVIGYVHTANKQLHGVTK